MSRELKYRAWDGKNVYHHAIPFRWELYTGKKDISGIEIYEGDIIRYDLRAGDGNPERKNLKREVKFYVTGYFSSYEENIKVIGNIHKNPQLL